jgi:hypothetical protein
MSACPNATAEYGDGRCGGTQLVTLQTTTRSPAPRVAPCPSCWQATGYLPIPAEQRNALTWWTLALNRLVDHLDDAQPALFGQQDQEAVDRYNAACRALKDAGVDTALRDRWHHWMMRADRRVPA